MEEKHRINKEILQKAVAKEIGGVAWNDVEIVDFNVREGSKRGDNFACVIKWVKFTYKVRGGEAVDHEYIVKGVPMNEARAKWIKNSPIFQTEVDFFNSLLDKLNAARSSHGMEDLATPKCFYASIDDGVLVLENLRPQGFALCPKFEGGLPDENVELALVTLAKFHATTYHYLAQYHGGVEKFVEDHPSYKGKTFDDFGDETMKEAMHKWWDVIFQNALEIVEKEDKELYAVASADEPNRREKFLKSQTLDDGPFITLIHGDYWYNNMMFRYKDGEEGQQKVLKDMTMLDFQIARVNTPALDLNYFLCSSTSPERRSKTVLDLWLKIYHDALGKELSAFGHSPSLYTFDDLSRDIDRTYYFGYVTGFMHAGVMVVDENNDIFDMENMTEEEFGDEAKIQSDALKMAANPAYVKRVLGLVKEAAARKMFD